MKSADCEKAMYTVLFCVLAKGTYFPPLIVYKGQHLYELWTVGLMEPCTNAVNQAGCTIPYLNYVKKMKKTVPLIYDCSGSHLTYSTAKLTIVNEMIIICLPPNRSHAIQTLDVGVFFRDATLTHKKTKTKQLK